MGRGDDLFHAIGRRRGTLTKPLVCHKDLKADMELQAMGDDEKRIERLNGRREVRTWKMVWRNATSLDYRSNGL